jgi:UDP-N-acetylglucosamine transferase subunit ALG13
MIFVTVGTHTQSFNRLLEELDKLVASGAVREKVVAQIGYSTYEPKHMEWFRFTDFGSLGRLYKTTKVLITHGGAGSILNGLSNKRPVVAVPRLKKYDEHVNDHQLDLVKALEKAGKIIAVYDIKNLRSATISARGKSVARTENKICEEILGFLKPLETCMK